MYFFEGGSLAVLGCPKGGGSLSISSVGWVGADLFWNDPFAKDAKCQKKCQALWNCTYTYKLQIPLSK